LNNPLGVTGKEDMLMATEIKATKDNASEIKEELQWHMRSLTLDLEQHCAKQLAPKKK